MENPNLDNDVKPIGIEIPAEDQQNAEQAILDQKRAEGKLIAFGEDLDGPIPLESNVELSENDIKLGFDMLTAVKGRPNAIKLRFAEAEMENILAAVKADYFGAPEAVVEISVNGKSVFLDAKINPEGAHIDGSFESTRFSFVELQYGVNIPTDISTIKGVYLKGAKPSTEEIVEN